MVKKLSLVMASLAIGCSAPDRTEVVGEVAPSEPAVIIDSIQWNGETLTFLDATTEEGGPEVAVSLLARDKEPELLLTLQHQLGRSPSAAELWLAAGGRWEDLPAELLASHEAQALQEGREDTLERPEVDVSVLEKTVTQSIFNGIFPNNTGTTGVTTSVCWDALVTETKLVFAAKRVCSGNGNAVVPFSGEPSCDPILNLNTTIRTGMQNALGGPLKGYNCFRAGNNFGLTCSSATVPGGFFFGVSFFKDGTPHRLATGAQWTGAAGPDLDNTVMLGSATLRNPGVPIFQGTTCTQH